MNVILHPAVQKAEAPLPANMPGLPGATALAPAKRKSRRGLLLGSLAAIALLGAAGYGGWQYWSVWRFEVSTDDAYVQADVVGMAPQVAGRISEVLVGDNQAVKAGDVLAKIDPRDFQAAVDQAKSGVAQAEARIASIEAEFREQKAVIDEAEATIKADQAATVYADQNNQRYAKLAKSGFGTVQTAQAGASQAESANAVVVRDQAALVAAQKQLDTITAQRAEAKAGLDHARAALEQAELNLGYTVLRAPTDGTIGMLTVRVGQYVEPGTLLLAVVPLEKAYVVANYKETQLADVKPGQMVSIDVDTYSGTSVRGIVNSVAPASGRNSRFCLPIMPPAISPRSSSVCR